MISENLNKIKLYKDQHSLRKEILDIIPGFTKLNDLPNLDIKNIFKKNLIYLNKKIIIKKIDYYYSNAICRSSKTMAECRKINYKQLKDGTNN
jgi:hypothetical protein